VDNQTILQSLTDAHKILNEAAQQCASYAAVRPYSFCTHASNYIAGQADELLQPIFES
jgi:hypothetical protein